MEVVGKHSGEGFLVFSIAGAQAEIASVQYVGSVIPRVDSTLSSSSSNAIASNAVYNALQAKADASALAAKANTADLAEVATTGSYNSLSDKPTIPAAQVQTDWNATSGMGQILNKPTLAEVATTGSYNSLSDKPSVPTVNNATLTIQKNGTAVDTFTANASENKSINITVPTTAADVNAVPTTRTINSQALSSDVTLTGADVAVTGYAKAGTAAAIEATDTVNAAIGKLEKALDGKQASGNFVTANTAITGATKTKITYDAKGLVTGGADLDAADIPALATSKVTTLDGYTKGSDATALAATDSLNTALSKLENQIDGKQAAGNYVPTSTTVNSKALSSNVTLTGADVAVTGYTKPTATSAIAATDTVNQAIGKLEKAILPVGTTTDTVAAGDDARFNTIATSNPNVTATGRASVWFE